PLRLPAGRGRHDRMIDRRYVRRGPNDQNDPMTTDPAAPVLLDVSDRIATLTLNRPAARNALSSELLSLLPTLMHEADGRDDVDVLILTGADPAFCAGLDLKELGT